MIRKYLLFFSLFFYFVFYLPSYIYADFALTGSSSLSGSVSTAMPITDVQVTGTGTEPIPVKLFVTSGTLSMSTTTGLTFDGASSGSTIYFSGSKTNINNALATLTYTRASAGSDTLEISLVSRGEVFFTENNHLYKFITGSITADNALTAAANQTAYGATGYLATITSQAENNFVAARLQGDGWMAGSDKGVEGDWKWLTGPEANTSFWSGTSNGSTVGGNYANWADGEPNDYFNGSPGEDCAQFYITTGKWNDLPCSGSNLSGYVVEFGAPGNMPTVTAKNVAITTVQNPTVNSFTPADEATGVSVSANLVIVFSKVVTKSTGDILIKKTADDTTVETIDASGAQIAGNNSSTITINPNTTLAETTSYYVTIPNTAFKDSGNNFYAGISNKTTWNFTTGDFTNPVNSNITSSSVTNTGVTITWNTDENTSTKVNYGLTNSYGISTAETNTSPRVQSHTASLTNLLECTTYHYAVISTDGYTNTTTSSDNTFTTTGCPASSEPLNTTANAIPANNGGTTTLTENNTQITVDAPSNFTDDAATVVIQVKSMDNTSILSSLGRPASVPKEVGSIVFDVKAIINSTTVLDSFDAPVTINYQYSDSDVQGLDESTFWLYHYHNGAWTPLNSCTLNTVANSISCTTESFSIFGLFGRQHQASSSRPVNTTGSPSCDATMPSRSPDLFQINVSHDQATLYFTPLTRDVTNYFVAYGYSSGDERFGTLTNLGPSSGVLSYTITHLDKNMTYYFKVRAQNGCMPGDWSGEMKITTLTTAGAKKSFYKHFISQILSMQPNKVSNVKSATITTKKPASKMKKANAKTCEYVVKPNDNLWDIAQEKLGDGSKYKDIMEENGSSSTFLRTGQVLKVGC